MNATRTPVIAFLSVLLSACVGRPAPRHIADLPQSFEHGGAAGSWPSQQWYRDFGSEELDGFVAAAVQANTDLAGARTRVLQADARARQAGAAILPALDADGTANYLAGHSSHGGGHELDWSALLSARYEVDYWGKNRAAAASARLSAAASRADRDALALTTLAGVASQYFQLLALRERLQVAQSNREVAQQLLAIVQARYEVAAASPIDLATQKAALDSAQIAIADLQQSEIEAQAALSTLLGRPPENFAVHGQPLDSLREPQVSAGLPSELLTRRPDIVLAEANLQAGDADLVAARAAMFPSLSLTASGGVANPALPATVLTIPGVGPSFALGANLVQPIFDHGRLAAQRAEVQARNEQLLVAYRASIIAALVDVENALAALSHLNQLRPFESDNLSQSERAFEGARLRYQAGSADFLTLLEAQRALYSARDQLIQYKLARLQAVVGLCKALGGGWAQSPMQSDRTPAAVGDTG
jgi:outer membrane protein, multidrug efflux system